MIDYNPRNWLTLIFALHKSDTLRMLWKELIYMGIFTLLIAFLKIHFFPKVDYLDKLIAVYSLIGFVISLLLVFRTNTAYDRWWEGRRKWGELVNDTRNFSVKLNAMLAKAEDKAEFARLIHLFVFSMKEHLRKGVLIDELPFTETEKQQLNTSKHIPTTVVGWIYAKIHILVKEGKLYKEDFIVLDKNLNGFLEACGACERIKNTPIPFSYSLFIKKFIFIYVLTLPLAFVSVFGYLSALIATFVFYVLVSMEVLAEEIEDPFGDDDNDLPTDELSQKMKEISENILLQK
jgi:ion channel-forming bestrophin family protein